MPHNNTIEKVMKDFKKGINADNISDPPSDTRWLEDFLRSALTAQKEEIGREIHNELLKKKIESANLTKDNKYYNLGLFAAVNIVSSITNPKENK